MSKHILISQRALGFYALFIIQLVVILPQIVNRLPFHGDIYLDITYAYDLKKNFELMGLGKFLKFFIFEATDHKAQPLSHLFFPFLFFISDPWIIHDFLAIFLNLLLAASIFYVLLNYSKSVYLPLVCTLCIVHSSVSTERLVSYELILVFSAMYWLAIARIHAAKNIDKIDPILIIASSIAFMCRPLDAAICFFILYGHYFKKYALLKNKNALLILAFSTIYWIPRLWVLWAHGEHLPRYDLMSLPFTIPVIFMFFFAAWNGYLLFKSNTPFISEPVCLAVATAISIVCAYYVWHIMMIDYSIFPVLLGTVALSTIICNSRFLLLNKISMSALTGFVLLYFISGGQAVFSMSLNTPSKWKRPSVFNSGPALAKIISQKKMEVVDFIYSERVIKNLPVETDSEMKVIQLIHLYMQNSLMKNGSYAHLEGIYVSHIRWWNKDLPANPKVSQYECGNFIIIDAYSEGEKKLSLDVKFFDRHREISNMSEFASKAQLIASDTLMEGVTWDTYYGEKECAKN